MSKRLWNQVPERYRGTSDSAEWPHAYTVEDVAELLKELPPDLPVHVGLGGFVTLVVYMDDRQPYLQFENCD